MIFVFLKVLVDREEVCLFIFFFKGGGEGGWRVWGKCGGNKYLIVQCVLFGFFENIECIYIYYLGIYLSDRNLIELFGKYFVNFEIFFVIFRIGIMNFLCGM